VTRFDRFCSSISDHVSRPTFFTFCVLLVVVWLIEGAGRILAGGFSAFFDGNYQLQINTTTTIITFLMVALLQNASQQDANAVNAKLDAVLKGLAEQRDTSEDMLERMIGAEDQIGATKPRDED
jgi:low affinity Fe/Cu permease